MALFAGEGAALNAYGAIFVESEQQITIKSAQWTRQKMQNWEILCWIVSGSPPFRLTFPNRSFLLLPHCHRNPVKSYFSYFWRMEQNIHKKYQVLNFKMARDEKKRVERRHSSGALSTAHHHLRAHLYWSSCICSGLTTQQQAMLIFNIHNKHNSRRPQVRSVKKSENQAGQYEQWNEFIGGSRTGPDGTTDEVCPAMSLSIFFAFTNLFCSFEI